jgi:hypothetical protein
MADQRADRDRQVACFKQVRPRLGVNDEKWQEFRNCVAGGIAPPAQTNSRQAQRSPAIGTPPIPAPSPDYAADERQCDATQSASATEKIVAACARLIDFGRKFGKLPPIFARALIARGTAYFLSRNDPPAIADLTEAIDLRPDLPLAFYFRGSAYADSGKLSLAIPDLDRALQLVQRMPSPDSMRPIIWAASLAARAKTYTRMGEYRKAVDDWKSYLAEFPEDPLQIRNDPDIAKAIAAVQGESRFQGKPVTFVCRIAGAVEPEIVTVDPERKSVHIEYRTEETKLACDLLFVDGVVAPVFRGATGGYCASALGNPTVRQSVTLNGNTISASGGNLRMEIDLSTAILRTESGANVCDRR